jgi:hypothetical protein
MTTWVLFGRPKHDFLSGEPPMNPRIFCFASLLGTEDGAEAMVECMATREGLCEWTPVCPL